MSEIDVQKVITNYSCYFCDFGFLSFFLIVLIFLISNRQLMYHLKFKKITDLLLLLNWLKLRKRKIGCKTYSSRTYKESNSFLSFFFFEFSVCFWDFSFVFLNKSMFFKHQCAYYILHSFEV